MPTLAQLEQMNIHELFEVCNTDPAHIETAPAWMLEAEAQAADASDWDMQVTELRVG